MWQLSITEGDLEFAVLARRLMRKLKCFQIGGATIQEVLDEFNERRAEFGIPDSDIVSVEVMSPTSATPIVQPEGPPKLPKVEVVIVYWDGNS